VNATPTERRKFLTLSGTGLAAGGLIGTGLIGAREAAAQAASDSLLRAVLDRGHLVVGTGSTNPPWHFEDEAGELQGLDIEMGKAIAFHLFDDDSKVEFIRQDPAARIPNVLTNKVDCVVQFMTVNGQRAQLVNFSRPYFLNSVSLLTLADGRFKTYEELLEAGSEARASILQNVDAIAIARDALPEAEIIQVDTQANVIQALDAGHVDAAYMSVSQVKWLRVQRPERYFDSGASFRPNYFSVALRQGDLDWLVYVNMALTNTMWGSHSKVFDAAYEKYLGLTPPDRKAGFPYFS
jgi:polar amino acid transport system substrate-binding protein